MGNHQQPTPCIDSWARFCCPCTDHFPGILNPSDRPQDSNNYTNIPKDKIFLNYSRENEIRAILLHATETAGCLWEHHGTGYARTWLAAGGDGGHSVPEA